MKKYSGKFILFELLSVFLISLIPSIALAMVTKTDNKVLVVFVPWMIIWYPMVALFYFGWCNAWNGRTAKKTMEKNSKAQGFGESSTFTARGSFVLGQIVRIDHATGRVAYVSCQNPRQFQMVHARELTGIQSNYIGGPFGGTRYVYFEFYYQNKRVRIPTFTSRSMYSMKSKVVQDSVAKAETYCQKLLRAQQISG